MQSVRVNLNSLKNPSDIRLLTLVEGEPITIGRASRSEAKDLHTSISNALFDCPVVSRSHAELRFNSFKLADEEITITDKGSMHGTVVNSKRLEPGVPYPLRSGDHLKFGDKVTRGSDIHDGVWVTFDRFQSYTKPSQTMRSSSGFQVPSDSEDGSDPESDNDSTMCNDVPGPFSSAMTTPEQAKVTTEKTMTASGTQEQPIDIDVDQLDNQVNDMDATAKKICQAQKNLFSDTYAESADAVSVGGDSEDEDVESVGSLSDEEEDDDEDDEDDEDDKEHEDNPTEWDAAELSDHYDESEADGPEVLSSKKEASPELGTPAEAPKSKDHDMWRNSAPAPKIPTSSRSTAYDPIRGSFPSSTNNYHDYFPPNTYGYTAAYGLDKSSWDIPPRAPPSTATQAASSSQPYYRPYSSYNPNAGATPAIPCPHYTPPTMAPTQTYGYSSQPPSTIVGATAESLSQPSEAVREPGTALRPTPAASAKSRISIPNIVDGSSNTISKPTVVEAPGLSDAAKPRLGMAIDDTCLKRKADDISKEEAKNIEQGWLDVYSASAPETQPPFTLREEPAAQQPAAKKARTMKSVSVEAAKYASAALLGGVGTVAFLATPMAQQLLDWM
ncbi:hypothetical protein LTR08_003037 [Meristemomyces frigidus]|nr:hypothetical protein LTR08_003037 [Meristemomyces frigidus]